MNKYFRSFKVLFKKYRLRSEIESLAEFADIMAEKGWVYDVSIYSHWQKGTRIPRNRKLLLDIIKIFIDRNGITDIDEGNLFLESTNQGYLTDNEKQLFKFNKNIIPFLAPQKFFNFIGREKEINEIESTLKINKAVIISGLPGVGKTSLAVNLAYKLRDNYPDGVLWARVDVTNHLNTIALFAQAYKENLFHIKEIDIRAQILRDILSKKKALIIFDNVNSDKDIYYLLPNSPSCSIIVTTRQKYFEILPNAKTIELHPFSRNDSYFLLTRILGKYFVDTHCEQLLKICNTLGNLPLALSILAKKLKNTEGQDFNTVITLIEKHLLEYLENKEGSIEASFNVSYNNLPVITKKVFSSLASFDGADFPLEAIAFMHQLNRFTTYKLIEELVDNSLLQISATTRYTLHPFIKMLAEKHVKEDYSQRIVLYFLSEYQKYGHREKIYNITFFAKDIDSIIKAFSEISKQIKNYELAVKFWEYLVITLWDLGMWDSIIQLANRMIPMSLKFSNDKFVAKYLIRNLCFIFFQRSKLKQAKKALKQGIKMAKKINDNFLLAYGCLRWGMIYLQEKKLPKSISMLSKAYQLFKLQKQKGRMGEALCYLSNAYLKKGAIFEAVNSAKEAYKICKIDNHKRCQADALSYLGEIMLHEKKYSEALKLFLKSIAIDEKIGRKNQIWIYNTTAINNLSKMLKKTVKIDSHLDNFPSINNRAKLSWRLSELPSLLNY